MSNITEKDIYRACIILSIIGLGVIHISHSYIQPDEVSIDQIDETWMGNTVKVEGEITSHTETQNAAFLEISDSTGSINLVDFEKRNITGRSSITGNVDIYQGDLQLVVKEVED